MKGHSNLLTNKKNLKMQYIRTPIEIWKQLSKEFNFTVDACASDKNHLLPKYWTKEMDALKQDWNNEIIYCHPMYDIHIPKFVKKAFNSKCITVFLLPASTNSLYFHEFLWDNKKHCPKKNVEVRFLKKAKDQQHGYKMATDEGVLPNRGYLRPLMIVVVNNEME